MTKKLFLKHTKTTLARFFTLLSLILSILFAQSCDPDPDPSLTCTDAKNPNCPNYDPCLSKIKAKAAFRLVDSFFNFGLEFNDNDTVYEGGRVGFEATTEGVSYEWKIGTDQRTFTTKKVLLSFLNDAIGHVDARLIVKKAPDVKCFPSDTGADTLVKRFIVGRVWWSEPKFAPILGNYKGFVDGNTKDTVSLSVEIVPNSGGVTIMRFRNYPQMDCQFIECYADANFVVMNVDKVAPHCGGRLFPSGIGKLSNDFKTLTLNYTIENDTGRLYATDKRIKKVFIGTKQ